MSKVFSEFAQAQAAAIELNDKRTPNKDGKLVGKYKVYKVFKDDVAKFAVGKSPASALSQAATEFGVNIEKDEKAVTEKMKPEDYLNLCNDDEWNLIAEITKKQKKAAKVAA